MMNHSKQGQNQLFTSFMKQNPNSDIYKSLISNVAKGIQQRTFWYFTSDDAEFLGNVYNKQINRQILKTRIQQITEQKMDQVFAEIIENKLNKKRVEDEDGLQVQLDFQDIQDKITGNYKPDRGKEKLREINEDFRRFKEKMDQIKRYQQMKRQQKAALEQQFKKSLQKEKRQEQRQQIRKNLQLLKQSGDDRKESNEKFKAFFKEYKKTKPLHIMMQQQYKQKVELPTIQENKKKLQMLAHKKKPTLEEINNHDKYYIQSKSSRPEKIIPNQTVDVSFKSQFYQLQEERLREFKELEENGYQWDYLQKQKRYSQFVKDKVKPKVSPKLKASLQQSLVKGYVHFQVPDRSKVIEVGKNYLQFMRSLQKNRRSATPNKPESIKQSRYINYLQELKSRSQHSHTTLDWERDLKDRGTSKLEKRQRILMKSKQLEQKAIRDQKFVSNNNFGRAEQILDKKKQIDETLLSSIRAKVAVLKDAREP